MKLHITSALAALALLTACSDYEPWEGTVSAPGLEKPSVTPGAPTFSSLTFSWQPVEGAVQYGLELTDPAGEAVEMRTQTATTATFTDLEPATTYTLQVWAYSDPSGSHSNAPAVTLTATTDPLTELAAPAPQRALSGSANVFSWAPVEGAEAYAYTVSNLTDGSQSSGSTSDTSVTIYGLTTGSYEFSLQATTSQPGYVDSKVATVAFEITRVELWRAKGTYTSAQLGQSWEAVIAAYDDDTYSILGWYGVEGYDLSFMTVEDTGDGTFNVLNGVYDENTGLYAVETGRTDCPTVNVYPWYGYSYMNGTSLSGTVCIDTNYGDSWDYDMFVWSPDVEVLAGVYDNLCTGYYLGDDWEWYPFNSATDSPDMKATITKTGPNTVAIDGLWWLDCPVNATVDFNAMTITIEPQTYAEYYMFASSESNAPDKPVVGTINSDLSIWFDNYAYWYDWGADGGWYVYLSDIKATLTRK